AMSPRMPRSRRYRIYDGEPQRVLGPSSKLSSDLNEIARNVREHREYNLLLLASCADAAAVDDISPDETEKARDMPIREPGLVKRNRRAISQAVFNLLLQQADARVQCVVQFLGQVRHRC